MRSPERSSALAVLVAITLLFPGCASTLAPGGWLPDAEQSTREANGGWIVAKVGLSGSSREVCGELIAIQHDSVFVLAKAGLEAIPAEHIRAARIARFNSHWGELGAWWVLGTLSTASHGFVRILSAPVWILGGTLSAMAASYAPIVRYPDRSWSELSIFARFPPGLPPGLDRSALRLRGAP